ENSKEVVKEGIDCDDGEACMNAEVSGGIMKNDEDSVRRDSEVHCDVISGMPEPFPDCDKDGNNTHNYNAVNEDNSNIESREKSYANKLSNGINVNNDLFFIPTGKNENGEKVMVFDEELVKERSEKWKFTKWEPETVIIKESPCKIPIWIRLLNIPLEAWSVRGISALASRLGRPIMMDQVTADMCRAGTRRLGYARVLVEINATDAFFDKIEINYVDEMKKVKSTKWVIVEYTWKPDRCSHCNVFGHSVQRCDAKPKPKPVVNNNIKTSDGIPGSADQEGFVKVRHRKNKNIIKQGWNRKSANKYVVLSEEEDHIKMDPFIDKRLLVDEFIKKKLQPNCEETKNWTYDMITYFKYQLEAMEMKEKEAWNIRGMCKDIKQKEIKKFIAAEKIQICAILETHLKTKNISRACDYVFGRWRWASNVFIVLLVVELWQGVERKELRNELSMHKSTVNNKAWVIMGDFNVTLKPEEHSNGASSMSTDMNEFKNAVNKIEVEDLRCTGFQFTWTKSLKNPMCNTLKKLDRIMINDSFIQMFEDANGVFLPYFISEHSPAITSIPRGITKKKNPLGLLTMLLIRMNFWSLLIKKGSIKANTLKEKLKVAQSNMDADPFNMAKRQITVNLVNEYTKVAEDELKLLHQKAKIQWLKEGDKNSAYFHNILKAKKNKSRIQNICCEDGSRVEGDLVNGQFVKHFQNFLGTTYLVLPLSTMGNIVKLKLSEAEALYMIKEVSDIEIKEALFDIDSSKAASPDGYTSCRILGEINATVITLVPKVDTPNKISDFRPIACCNVLYKCISKIPTNRIKDGLSKVVSLNQSAFIPRRHIQDHILITQELLKGYNMKNGAKRCAMKIDIQKAYDTISWDFLREVMLMVGFHDTMVHWIMTCITSASFSICINGEINGFFKWGRGLRQGDPILPYLFTLVMENSGGSAKGNAKVAWKNVCRPKVHVVSTVKLKRKSIREAEINNNDSHGWKELIRIRDKIKPYVIFKIGDGKSISDWHDRWCDQGPLDRFIQNRDIYDVRMSNEDCLVDAIVEGR
nr:hypothetical protein [Tanacetum cinerariifolium]